MERKLHLCLAHLGGNEEKFVKEAFDTDWVTSLGPNVDMFEQLLDDYLRRNATGFSLRGIAEPHTLAVASGTAAVHLGLLLLGVKPGDEVICQSWTFAASVNPVVYCGAKPVMVDSEPATWNIDPQLLEEAILDRRRITGKTPKAIVAVDLYGMPAQWDAIHEVASRFGIPVLEDSAEALGSTYKGIPCGMLGRLGVFSFNGNKMITTGAGGALVCPDAEMRAKALFYATQAREAEAFYQHEEIGFNYRMSNISAGVGRGQMEVLDEHIAHHRKVADLYAEALAGIDGVEVHLNPGSDFRSNYWLSTVLFDAAKCGSTPDEIRLGLAAENIESRPLWKPMHQQPVFKDAPRYLNGTSGSLWQRGLCLPSGPRVKEDDVLHVAEEIKNLLNVNRQCR